MEMTAWPTAFINDAGAVIHHCAIMAVDDWEACGKAWDAIFAGEVPGAEDFQVAFPGETPAMPRKPLSIAEIMEEWGPEAKANWDRACRLDMEEQMAA